MLDDDQVDQLRLRIISRFTAEELCEILNLEAEDIFEKFIDECLQMVDWSEHL